jgi:putative ABC transport system permease protein
MFRSYFAAALRNLARNRLYAGVTIAGLAIGFAAAMLIALFVRDEYSYDRFVPGNSQVYRVSESILNVGERAIESDVTPMMLAPALKLDFRQVQYAARLSTANFPPSVQRGNFSAAEPNLGWADPDFFRVMPMPTIAGDLAGSLDAPDSIVLTRTVARKYFGRDAPIGEALLVDKHPMRVTAVLEDLPSNTHLISDIFASGRSPYSALTHLQQVDTPLNNVVATYVRLRPGSSVSTIEPQLPGFVRRHYALERYNSTWAKTKIIVRPVPLTAIHLRPSTQGAFKPAGDKTVIAAIAGVGVLVVLVAAINFITLMTARAGRRAVEVGVRKAAGASRRDLIVQFMGEAFLYVVFAVVFAIAIAELALPAFNALLQRRIAFDYATDPMLAAGIGVAALLVAILAGAYPAFVLSAFRPAAVLKGGLPPTGGGVGVRQALVIVQFAVLIALVLGAITIARQTWYALNQGMRLDKDQVLFIAASPCTDRLRDAVLTVPGVQRAACASASTLLPSLSNILDDSVIDGRHETMTIAPVDFGFFEVYGLEPLAGRLFDRSRPSDGFLAGSEVNPPVVINETAVKKLGYTSPQAALGHTVMWHFHADPTTAFGQDPARPSQIIGVIPDFTFGSMRSPIEATLYMVGPKVSYYSIALSAKLDGRRIPESLAGIDRVWKRIEGDAPIQRVFVTLFTLRLYIDTIIQGALITIAAVVALSIAALGLFALSAYTTERRTKEIGIRKAMGADTGDILRLLIWQFTKPVLWANLIAWPVSFLALTGWLGGFAYHVDLAPWTFAAAAGAALVIAWATVFVHALRVARAKPVGALRYE